MRRYSVRSFDKVVVNLNDSLNGGRQKSSKWGVKGKNSMGRRGLVQGFFREGGTMHEAMIVWPSFLKWGI